MKCIHSSFSIIFFSLAAASYAQPSYIDGGEYGAGQLPTRGGVDFSIGALHLDPEQAYKEGVGEHAVYLKAGLTLIEQGNFIANAGVSGYLYDDNQRIYLTVEDPYGHRDYYTSNADSFGVFAEAGVIVDISPKLWLELMLGYDTVIRSNRSVSECECHVEDIDFDGGGYFMPKLKYQFNNNMTAGFGYQTFGNSDLESAWMVSLGFSY